MKKKLSLGVLGLLGLAALASAVPANAGPKGGSWLVCNFFGACSPSSPGTPTPASAPVHPLLPTPTPSITTTVSTDT